MSGVDVSIHHVTEVRIDAPHTLSCGTRVQDMTIVYLDLCNGEWVTCESVTTLFFEDGATLPQATTEEE